MTDYTYDQSNETPVWLSQSYLVGHPLELHGHYAEALNVYNDIIVRDPHNILAYLLQGGALSSLKRGEEGRTSFLHALHLADQALNEHPNDVRAHVYRADALWEIGQKEEALAAYDRALQLAPEDYEVHLNKGWAQYVLAHYDEALTLLQRALELHPDDVDILYYLNNVYWDIGEYTKSLEALERAIALDPSQRRLYIDKATTLSYMGRIAESKEAQARYEQMLQGDS